MIKDMAITYTNKDGMTIVDKNAERFDIRGTIMSVSFDKVCELTRARVYVEDSEGGKSVSIWNTAKGYSRSRLRTGHSVRFKGISHKQFYDSEKGVKSYIDYRAFEME